MKTSRAISSNRYRNAGPQLVHNGDCEAAVSWAEYPRIEPGVYSGYCKWAGWYRDPGFKRWTFLLRFDVFRSDGVKVLATIPMWLNGGSGDKPKAGRRGRYLAEWVKANGEPPVRNDRLSKKIFIRRMARLLVGDTTKGPAPYSVVREILDWSTGTPVNQSHSQGTHQVTDTQ